MTATKNDAKTATPDESTRTTEVAGRCNHPMTTADGALDRCSKSAGHKHDHVSWTSHSASAEKRKRQAEIIAKHDPEVRRRKAALAAKKLAALKALAAELGYELTKAAEEG